MNIIETIFIALIGTLVGFVIGMSGKGKKKSINRVHFYVARDSGGLLWLYLGKPERSKQVFVAGSCGEIIAGENGFYNYGLDVNDYANLIFEDEPVEVFLNLKY